MNISRIIISMKQRNRVKRQLLEVAIRLKTLHKCSEIKHQHEKIQKR